MVNTWKLAYIFLPLLVTNTVIGHEQQFVYLAHSFINHSFSLVQPPTNLDDLALYRGKYFWPLGPFPAFILMPLTAIFNLAFLQGYLQFPANVLNFALVFKISKKLSLSEDKAFALAVFYIFGSVYTPAAAISLSWYFAQVIATSLVLLAINEYLNSRRYLVIGILTAFATLTRLSLALSVIFFLIPLAKKPINLKNISLVLFPIILGLVILAFYNYKRFDNVFETGYKYQIIHGDAESRRAAGIFSLAHIPANLYYMLLEGPAPILKDSSHILKFPYLTFNPYGLSILITSPILFLLFKLKIKDFMVKESIVTILALCVPLITYYGIGYIQVGYRYALDFFPFLLMPIVSAVKNVKFSTARNLVILGVIITWFFTIEKLSGF